MSSKKIVNAVIARIMSVFNVSVAPGRRIAGLFRGQVVACILFAVYKKERSKLFDLTEKNIYIKTNRRLALLGKNDFEY